MISTDKFKLDIIDNGSFGNGIGKIDGKAYFVPFTIKGEKVLVHLTSIGKKFCECELDEIITPSQNRVTPKCKYFSKCAGCSLQHMNKTCQHEFKTNYVANTLRKTLGEKIKVNPCIGLNEYNYRNKANFSIRNYELCFFDEQHEAVFVDECPIFRGELSQIIVVINTYLKSIKPKFRAVHIRNLNGVFQITFVSNTYDFPNSRSLISEILSKNINFSLNICKNTTKNSSNLTNDIICIHGEEKLDYEILNIKNKISPSSFLQVNAHIQNKIYEDIIALLSSTDTVINGYGGTGILSAIAAQKSKFVYSVEINRDAYKNCLEMINKNNLKNITAFCGDCKSIIPELVKNNEVSFIIFDPPRSGIDQSILDIIKESNIPNLLYLSCNPSTLARDLSSLKEKYDIISVQPYDMFPQTAHVETLVYLKKL